MMLPSDRYLADILGLTEEQYRHFQIEVRKRAAEGPQPAVVAGTELIIAAVSLAISVGATAVSLLLKPSIPQANQAPGQPRQQQQTTDPIIRNTSFAPRFGFDSQQDIATLGSTIPLVYAKREEITGTTYGGIRINTPMVWNQIISLGSGQLLRAVFLLGESAIDSVDVDNFALGSNTFRGYQFDDESSNQTSSRLSIYLSKDGGRIDGNDRVFGRREDSDSGSSGPSDVFRVFYDSQERTDFCSSNRPSTQTTFGVYAPIGNNLMYRVNPTIRPGVRSQYQANTGDGRLNVQCPNDQQQINRREKFRARFAGFSGIVDIDGTEGTNVTTNLLVNSRVTYKLFRKSDWDTSFGSGDDRVRCRDVASAVASRQKSFDDRIVVGELYKIGSALGVCISRTELPFASQADFEGNISQGVNVTAIFKIVEAGVVTAYTENTLKTIDKIRPLGVGLGAVTAGSGYAVGNYSNVALTGGQGIGATANIKVEFIIELGTISGGSGYAEETYLNVPLTGGSGSGAEATIVVNASGVVSSVTITNSGSGYVAGDSLSALRSSLGGGTGTDFSVPVSAASNGVTSVSLAQPGLGYRPNDSLSAAASDLGDANGNGFSVLVDEVEDGGDNYEAKVATTGGHLLRYSTGQIPTSRACKAVEFGLRSNLGIRVNGLCNFRDAKTYKFADESYCEEFENAEQDEIKSSLYQSGVVTSSVERYSFFKIKYRELNSASWTTLNNIYGVRSETQQSTFNYIRLEFNSVKQREFAFEPLSGYEVRNETHGVGTTLYVLDSKLPSISPVSENGTTVVFDGESVSLNEETFRITYGKADDDLPDAYDYEGRELKGLRKTDANTYIDDYGKLAETFAFSEIASSADSGPEHEIVYVNEIVPNTTAPLYDDLALVGINIRSSAEFQQFAQFSTYVTGGKVCNLLPLSGGTTGATHLFPEVLYDLLTNTRYGAGSFIKADMIDEASFTAAAQWCQARKYFYDAAIAEPINIRQFAADLSATHLLQFGESDGKYFLNTALPISDSSLQVPAPIAGLFTAGNIAEDSFQLQYFDPEDRDPIQISVKYREERPSTDLNSPGLFPVVREVLVREDVPEASETDPTEQVDVSDFCTSREHAIDAAKFLIRMRRIPTHTISFATTHDAVVSSLAPGDYIKVAMDETEYDEFNNGVVTPEGALVSTKALADGTYNVVAWDGTEGTPPADATLTVSSGGKTASPVGIVFTVKLPSTQIRVYQIERISPTDDGTFTIEALHMPVNSSGVLQVADGFDTASNWVIEG